MEQIYKNQMGTVFPVMKLFRDAKNLSVSSDEEEDKEWVTVKRGGAVVSSRSSRASSISSHFNIKLKDDGSMDIDPT